MRGVATIILLLLSTIANAVLVSELYTEKQPAPQQSATEREALIRRGLETVFTRISPVPNLSQQRAIQTALKDAGQYVQKYAYESTPEGNVLVVAYDANRLQNTLTSAELPFWGAQRPLTLLWLAVDTPEGRFIVGEQTEPFALAVAKSAQSLRVPVQLPALDLEDLARVSATDVWGGFMEILSPASQRYAPDVLAVVRLEHLENGAWRGEWQLRNPEIIWQWMHETSTWNAQVETGLQALSVALGQQYAVRPHGPVTSLRVSVSRIRSFEDYAKLMQYLQQLPIVQDLQVSGVGTDTAQIEMKLRGDGKAFQQALAMDHQLLAQDDAHYEWIP